MKKKSIVKNVKPSAGEKLSVCKSVLSQCTPFYLTTKEKNRIFDNEKLHFL